MPSISAIVITRNEERHLQACLESLRWADEIVVLDSLSTDRTVEVARRFTDKVFQREFVNFPQQRNAAVELAGGDWVFFLDADERVTPQLAREIQRAVATTELAGYLVPRQNIILGRWMKYAGWSPDYQLRLFQRDKGRYDERREVHETVILDGRAGYLKNAIVHYNYESVRQLFARQNRYSRLEARALYSSGIRAKPQNFILQPLREFKRRYINWRGYRGGLLGLFLCLVMAWYSFTTYVKLARMRAF